MAVALARGMSVHSLIDQCLSIFMAVSTFAPHTHSRRDCAPVHSISTPTVSGSGTARHLVVVAGPDTEDAVRIVRASCSELELSLRIIHTESEDCTDASLAALAAAGEIGAHTQLVVIAHGDSEGDRHVLGVLEPEYEDTVTFLRWLRLWLSSDVDPATGNYRPWKGMTHVLSCCGLMLADMLASSKSVLDEGPTLIYASDDVISKAEAARSMRSLCEYIDACRATAEPTPHEALAWMARSAATPVALVGAEVGIPIVLHPGCSVLKAMPDYLLGQLKQMEATRLYDASMQAKRQHALGKVAEAIEREGCRKDSALLKDKLTRLAHEQAQTEQVSDLVHLVKEVPPLVHTVNAFGAGLTDVMNDNCRKACKKAVRSAAKHSGVSGKENAKPMGQWLRERFRRKTAHGGATTQDAVIAAAVRRLVKEPDFIATALPKACAQGDTAMLEAIYEAVGPEPFEQRALIRRCSGEAVPLLHLACLIKRPELVALLLEHGADVNGLDREGKTAMHHAVLVNSVELIKVLQQANADTRIEADGKTPVKLAAMLGFEAGLSLLATSAYWESMQQRL